MLLNLSNHPSSNWTEKQRAAAGMNVIDMPFPRVDPEGNEAYIDSLVDEYFNEIMSMKNLSAVHIMGEFNFCFALITKLQARGIKCVASTSTRQVEENEDMKLSTFNFVRFREYANNTSL